MTIFHSHNSFVFNTSPFSSLHLTQTPECDATVKRHRAQNSAGLKPTLAPDHVNYTPRFFLPTWSNNRLLRSQQTLFHKSRHAYLSSAQSSINTKWMERIWARITEWLTGQLWALFLLGLWPGQLWEPADYRFFTHRCFPASTRASAHMTH